MQYKNPKNRQLVKEALQQLIVVTLLVMMRNVY